MRELLHILTRPDDALAQGVINEQRAQSGVNVQTFDLTAAEPDYRKLLEAIFKADSVSVW